ncbi:MAG: hypothetical protein P4L62_00105 [Candidatus Pacebacteria bacterium]|nr:hypothetical protein [Candidatus Paceibacterota bacterium]MDR3582751.1 hypothetical protein [Candidatus Paceibacterota bacterium]
MEFSLNKNKKSSILKSRWFISIIGVIMVFALTSGNIFYSDFAASDIYFALFFLVCFIIALLIFFYKQKAFGNFVADEEGIKVNDKLYSWDKAINYHWLGEAQGERIGAVGIGGALQYDPMNPNEFADTKVARIKIKEGLFRHSYINLEVDNNKAGDLVNVFEQHQVKHLSQWREIVGI